MPTDETPEPLFDAEGMRSADSLAIEERGIPSLRLMEAAGEALADAVREVARPGRVAVLCGKGNNGGDGLVVTRLLADTGFEAEALLLWPAAELTGDAATNLERLGGRFREVDAESVAGALQGAGCVVDAIFGTGFDGAPRSPAAEAIEAANACGAPIVAADIASGVDASSGEAEGVAIEADVTVSFHAGKLGHRIAPGKRHTGKLVVADIGIPGDSGVPPSAYEIGTQRLRQLPSRGAESTKFTSGRVVVVGASRGLTGSVALAAGAASRAGAGYATVVVPGELEAIFEVKLTVEMSRGVASANGSFAREASGEILEAADGAGAVVLGPGLGRSDAALAVARDVAGSAGSPLILDADGLNAHAGRIGDLATRAAGTVITPHAGELGRLLGTSSEAVSKGRLAAARQAAREGRCIVVLKGADTIVTDFEGRLEIAVTPSPALATAGTGDVLAGTIGALVARGVEPFDAACAAVHANARAGLIAAKRVGSAESVIASDVVDALPSGLSA